MPLVCLLKRHNDIIMSSQYKVFHAINPTFALSKEGVVFNDSLFKHVATVECDGLEHVFTVTNHINDDWTKNKEVIWKSETGANIRSTSCGDIIIDSTGKKFYVAGIGFQEIT